MKYLKFLTILGLVTMLLVSPVAGQQTDPPHVFTVSPDHQLTVIAKGDLSWSADAQNSFSLNFTMSEYRVNNSEIKMLFVQYFFVDSAAGSIPRADYINSTQVDLTTSNTSVLYQHDFLAPKEMDRFYLNITFQVQPIGGGVDESPVLKSVRFPAESTIIVERNNLVPAVNLYGFPQASYFSLWLPVYGTFLFFLLTPSFLVVYQRIKDTREESSSTQSSEENENGEGGKTTEEEAAK